MLRYFITIAEEGSISKAAEKLMITQPTLSCQLKNLEQEIGALVCIEGAVKNRIDAEVTFVPMEPSLYSETILVWKESRYLSLVTQEFLKRIKVYYPAELF